MNQLQVQDQAVDHTASDRCRMTFTTSGAGATLDVVRMPKATALAASAGRSAPTFADELRSQGFVPVGDAFRMTPSPVAAAGARGVMEVAIDKPGGHYVIGVVTEGPRDQATWYLPEPDVVVVNSSEASAFSRATGPGPRSSRPTVRALFRIPIPQAPASVEAGPMKAIERVVRFFKVKVQKGILALETAKKKLGDKLVTFVDKKILKAPEGLKIVRPDMKLPRASKAQLAAMEGEDVLLLVHGIFSSIRGAFGKAAVGASPPVEALVEKYDKRVLGFDHWTVGKSTLDNARDLVAALPKGAKLNIVCHSRGGGVVRCLLEHPTIARKMQAKGVEVDTVVFVAGACLGSPLAHPSSVDRLINGANRLLRLAGLDSLPVKAVTFLFKLLLHGIQKLPGIEAMNPSAKIFATLRAAKATLASRYVYFRANFDPKNLPARVGDEVVLDQAVFRGKGNDGIVPYAGAGVTRAYLSAGQVTKTRGKDFGTATRPDTSVWHTNFFAQPAVRAGLLRYV